MNPFYNRDVISVNDFSKDELELLFRYADKIADMSKGERLELARGSILAYAFFEPSTRTRLGFEAAMLSIGGSTLGMLGSRSTSMEKGESIKDTIRVIDLYADIIVMRHYLDGSARFAAEIASHPLINAGSGMEEHPTQAMLDLYTIQKEKGSIDGLRIGIVGDLKYARTVYSLIYALDKYDVRFDLISPNELSIRKEYITDLKHQVYEHERLDDVINELDIIYVTRIQKERFPDEQEYMKVKGSYVIDKKILDNIKSDAVIMHPLPRIDEIKYEVDNDKRAAYFRQVKYGKDIKTALLALIINEYI